VTRNVEHACGHVVEWSAETAKQAAFGFFLASAQLFPCPFCGGETGLPVESWIREIRYGGSPLPGLLARRLHEWGA
jgi:hypothetical protein